MAKERWITVNGNHILIKEGQTVNEAIKERFGVNDGKTHTPSKHIYKGKYEISEDDGYNWHEVDKDTYKDYEADEDLFDENDDSDFEIDEEKSSPINEFNGPDKEISNPLENENVLKGAKQEYLGELEDDFDEDSPNASKMKKEYDKVSKMSPEEFGKYLKKKLGEEEYMDYLDMINEDMENDPNFLVNEGSDNELPHTPVEMPKYHTVVENGQPHIVIDEGPNKGKSYDNEEDYLNSVRSEEKQQSLTKTKVDPEDFEDARFYPTKSRMDGIRWVGRYHSIHDAFNGDDKDDFGTGKFKSVGSYKGASIYQLPDGYYSINPRITSMSFKSKEALQDYLDHEYDEDYRTYDWNDKEQQVFRKTQDGFDEESPDAYKRVKNKLKKPEGSVENLINSARKQFPNDSPQKLAEALENTLFFNKQFDIKFPEEKMKIYTDTIKKLKSMNSFDESKGK